MNEKFEDDAARLNYQITQLNHFLETTSMIRNSDDLNRISRDIKTATEIVMHAIATIQWANSQDDDI